MITDLYDVIKTLSACHPAAARTNGTITGASIDRNGFESVTFVCQTGAYTDGTHAVSIEDSEDDGAGSPASWGAAATGDLKGSLSFAAAGGASKTTRIAYIGAKRWVRAKITTSGATSGAFINVVVVLSHARESILTAGTAGNA